VHHEFFEDIVMKRELLGIVSSIPVVFPVCSSPVEDELSKYCFVHLRAIRESIAGIIWSRIEQTLKILDKIGRIF